MMLLPAEMQIAPSVVSYAEVLIRHPDPMCLRHFRVLNYTEQISAGKSLIGVKGKDLDFIFLFRSE